MDLYLGQHGWDGTRTLRNFKPIHHNININTTFQYWLNNTKIWGKLAPIIARFHKAKMKIVVVVVVLAVCNRTTLLVSLLWHTDYSASKLDLVS